MILRLVLSFYFFCYVTGNSWTIQNTNSQKTPLNGEQIPPCENEEVLESVSNLLQQALRSDVADDEIQTTWKETPLEQIPKDGKKLGVQNNFKSEFDDITGEIKNKLLTIPEELPKRNTARPRVIDLETQDCFPGISVKRIVMGVLQHIKQNPYELDVLLNELQAEIDAETHLFKLKNDLKADMTLILQYQRPGAAKFDNYPKCSAELMKLAKIALKAHKDLETFPLCLQLVFGYKSEPQTQTRENNPDKNLILDQLLEKVKQYVEDLPKLQPTRQSQHIKPSPKPHFEEPVFDYLIHDIEPLKPTNITYPEYSEYTVPEIINLPAYDTISPYLKPQISPNELITLPEYTPQNKSEPISSPQPEFAPVQPQNPIYQPEDKPRLTWFHPTAYTQPDYSMPEIYESKPKLFPMSEFHESEPEVYPMPEFYELEPEVYPMPVFNVPEPKVYPMPEFYEPELKVYPMPEFYEPEPEVYQPDIIDHRETGDHFQPEVYEPHQPKIFSEFRDIYPDHPEIYDKPHDTIYYEQNGPVYTEPVPVESPPYTVGPKSTYVEPIAVYVKPKNIHIEPLPIYIESKPIHIQQEPFYVEPSPINIEPKPYQPQSTTETQPQTQPSFESSPNYIDQKLAYIKPTPDFIEPQPTYLESQSNYIEVLPNSLHYIQPEYVKPTSDYIGPTANYKEMNPDYIETQATYVEPRPTYVKTSPTYVKPSPTYVKPSPTYVKPSVSYEELSPTYVQPSPTYVESSPINMETNPIYIDSDSIYIKPKEIVEPLFIYMKPTQEVYPITSTFVKPSKDIFPSPSPTDSKIVNLILQLISDNPSKNIETIFTILEQNQTAFKPGVYKVLFALLNLFKQGMVDPYRFKQLLSFLLQPQQKNVWNDEKKQVLWYLLTPDETGQVDITNLDVILVLIQARDTYTINILDQILPLLKSIKDGQADSRTIAIIRELLNQNKKRILKPHQVDILLKLIKPDKMGRTLTKHVDIASPLVRWNEISHLKPEYVDTIFSLLRSNVRGRIDPRAVDIIREILSPKINLNRKQIKIIFSFLKTNPVGIIEPKRLDIVLLIIKNINQAPRPISVLIELLRDADIINSKYIDVLLSLQRKEMLNYQLLEALISQLKQEQSGNIDQHTINNLLLLLEPYKITHPKTVIEIGKILSPVQHPLTNLNYNLNTHPDSLISYLKNLIISQFGDVQPSGASPIRSILKGQNTQGGQSSLKFNLIAKILQMLNLEPKAELTAEPIAQTYGFVELTYMLKQPDAINQSVYYVKYRIPLVSFLTNVKTLITQHPQLTLDPAKLVQELIIDGSVLEVSEVSPNLKGYRDEDILKLTSKDGDLVQAKVLDDKSLNLNDQIKLVHNLNLDVTPQEILQQNKMNAAQYYGNSGAKFSGRKPVGNLANLGGLVNKEGLANAGDYTIMGAVPNIGQFSNVWPGLANTGREVNFDGIYKLDSLENIGENGNVRAGRIKEDYTAVRGGLRKGVATNVGLTNLSVATNPTI